MATDNAALKMLCLYLDTLIMVTNGQYDIYTKWNNIAKDIAIFHDKLWFAQKNSKYATPQNKKANLLQHDNNLNTYPI